MEKKDTALLKKELNKKIEHAIKNHVFTACSIGFVINNAEERKRYIFNYGLAEGFRGALPVDNETLFDLASLTKPLVTSLCLLSLIEEGKIGTADTLDSFFARVPFEKRNISLLHLLTHSSGLPAHRPYYKKLVHFPQSKRMESIIAWILAENLDFYPGTAHRYSDLGFILLGRIIEKISGKPLQEYWEKTIIQSIGSTKGLFFPGKEKTAAKAYANTGMCEWSKKRLTGLVHDDNCRALGGVAGHAGLFGNCDAVLSLCEMIARQFRSAPRKGDSCSNKIKEIFSETRGSWLFGFDTPTAGTSSSGRYFSEMSLGHLGFTGTSFWIDLQRGISIVLLTNRVACGEATAGIKKIRPLLHDIIMEFLIKKSG
jgi:CubicO group peptidase (beta-lactamase class C family)